VRLKAMRGLADSRTDLKASNTWMATMTFMAFMAFMTFMTFWPS
jgi:hypothetical protein